MDEREMNEFSWTGLFLVTSFCFFAFSGVLELLNNTHPVIFTWIGGAALLLGLLNAVLIHKGRASSKG
ncbi:MAG: hypothetical protein ABUT20_42460 [Bacteroidota bacterium]